MSTTRTTLSARSLEADRRADELPPLGAADRAALRIGLALILWGQRHDATRRLAEERAEASRRSGVAARAAAGRDAALAHRHHAGTTW